MADTARHLRAKEIFVEVYAQPEDQWRALVEKACGDDAELRDEVSSLLSFHDDDSIGDVPSDEALDGQPGEGPTGKLAAGTIIASRYRIVSYLGAGGMGEVYRADDLRLGHEIAIKFLHPKLAARRVYIQHLRNEVRVARQVTHQSVCRVYDLEETEGNVFITMEYIDGENLASLLKRIGRLPPERVVGMALQLCSGIAAAHSKGIIHRDLKPGNIMVDSLGRVRITDFGIAVHSDGGEAVGVLAGTPMYMAPEQLKDFRVSVQSDLYTLGMVLYEMCTGLQVAAASPHSLTLPSKIVPGIDPSLERAILCCLEEDPHLRPYSAVAVSAALSSGESLQTTIDAGQTPPPELVAAPINERRMHPAVSTACLACFFLFFIMRGFLGTDVPRAKIATVKSPEVLAEAARELLGKLGYSQAPLSRAYGFTLDPWDGAHTIFWYRQSSEELVPSSIENAFNGDGNVTFTDPPPYDPGTVRLFLDLTGRLRYLRAIPDGDAGGGATAADPAWSTLLASAGVDGTTLTPAKPPERPIMFADNTMAWEGPDTGRPGEKVRYEAAVYRGRLVYFDRSTPAPEPEESPRNSYWSILWNAQFIGAAIVVIAAIPLARRNIRQGRADLKNAIRVSVVTFCLLMSSSLVSMSWQATTQLITVRVASALMHSGILWLLYLAIEPYVRLYWPQSLVSWTRLLEGHLRDPRLCEEILFGAMMGGFFAVALFLEGLAPGWFGLQSSEVGYLHTWLLGTWRLDSVLGGLLFSAFVSLRDGFLAFVQLVLLRMLFKRSWLAIAVFALYHGIFFTLYSPNPATSWVTSGLIMVGLSVYLLIKRGLVAFVVASFAGHVIMDYPLILGGPSWYNQYALFASAFLMALVVFGYCCALRRGPVLQAASARS